MSKDKLGKSVNTKDGDFSLNIGVFGDKVSDVIREGGILQGEELDFLLKNIETSSDVWKKVQRGRTETELRFSVLDDIHHPNPDSKYWQIYREANVQFESLVFASYEWREDQEELNILEADIEELELDIEELKEELKGEKKDLNKKKIKVKIKRKEAEKNKKLVEFDRKKLIMLNSKASSTDRVRELKSLYQIRDELLPQLEFGTQSPNDHQLISYAHALTIQVYNGEQSNWEGSSVAEINNIKGVQETCLKEILTSPQKTQMYLSGLPQPVSQFMVPKIAPHIQSALLEEVEKNQKLESKQEDKKSKKKV